MYNDNSDCEYDAFYSESDDSDYEKLPNGNVFQSDPRQQLEDKIQDSAKNGRIDDLHLALFDNNIKIDVNASLAGEWSALMYAAFASQSEIVDYLIKNKADVNKCTNGLTPLMCACSSESFSEISNLSCIKKLLEAGAQVNVADKNRQTPLMRAIDKGKVHAAKLLIPQSNVEMFDLNHRTAIFYAVLNKQDKILMALIERGACLEKLDKFKNSIKNLALSKNHEPTLNVLQPYLFEKEPYDDFTTEVMKDWKEMFPGILDKKSAHSYEIPTLLFGMHCEKLMKPVKAANIDLFQFLSLTEDDMKDINISLPFLRKRLKFGLYKFHAHKWNMNTVLGYSSNLKKNMDYQMCLDYFSSHMKQFSVMTSTFTYINKNTKKNEIALPTEIILKIDSMLNQIGKIKAELKNLEDFLSKVNKRSPLPADLIGPQKKTIITKKCIVYMTLLSAILIISTTKALKN